MVNEIVLRAMKSERGSDEIFSVPPQMKLNPSYRLAAARSRSRYDNALRCHSLRSRRFATPRSGISSRSDFIHRRWIYPVRKDGFS